MNVGIQFDSIFSDHNLLYYRQTYSRMQNWSWIYCHVSDVVEHIRYLTVILKKILIALYCDVTGHIWLFTLWETGIFVWIPQLLHTRSLTWPLFLQTAPHHHQLPPPLPGCLRLPCRPPVNAGWYPSYRWLLVLGKLYMWTVLLCLFSPYICLSRKHGAHIRWPLCCHLWPFVLPYQSHSEKSSNLCLFVLGLFSIV